MNKKSEYKERIDTAIEILEYTNFEMVDDVDKLFNHIEKIIKVLKGNKVGE